MITPVCGATSTYPFRTTHFAGVLSWDCQAPRSLPSNSTIASAGGGTGGRSGPGSTTGGRGRSRECTGHCCAGERRGLQISARSANCRNWFMVSMRSEERRVGKECRARWSGREEENKEGTERRGEETAGTV